MPPVYFTGRFSARLSGMDIHLFRSSERENYDAFVAAHPHGGVEQSWAFGELQTRIPGRPKFYALGVMDGDKIIASLLLIRQQMSRSKTWLWCPRGPLLPEDGGEEAWAILRRSVQALAKEFGDVFVRIEPGVPREERFVPNGKRSKTRYLPGDTLILDLSLSEADLLAQMTQKGRYNIKQAAKEAVTVREAGLKGLSAFYEILKDTADRDGFALHKKDFYEDFLKLLDGKLYVAYKDDEPVGGLLLASFGETATYYFGASSSAHRESKAPYLLQWTAIQDAKQAGMKVYDFLGIAPEGDNKHELAGVTQFKTRFGGKRVAYHDAQVFVYRPLWWLAYLLAKRFKR